MTDEDALGRGKKKIGREKDEESNGQAMKRNDMKKQVRENTNIWKPTD